MNPPPMAAGRPSRLEEISSFGGVAAEADTLLDEYFLRTAAYQEILDQRRFIVVGRKGTGKTAIYRQLQGSNEAGTSHAAGLQFENYPWGAHNEVANTMASTVERFTESWRFLILVETAKLVLASNRIPIRGRALRRFLKRNWGSQQFGVHRVFEPSTYDVDFAPSAFGWSIGALRRKRTQRPELAGFLSARNDWLKNQIRKAASSDHEYYVLFDGLDIAYTSIDDLYTQRIIGLLLAARDVFSWSKEHHLNISPVVFLRSDIYAELTFADQNKMTEDNVQLLTWNDDATGESSLKTLMDERIRSLLHVDEGTDPWTVVFEPSAMRGTQQKYKYMVERTYLRPRDMIKFANVCLANAKAAHHDRITNDDIYNAKDEYSDYVVSELSDEISAINPGWLAGLELLRDIHRMTFERPRFEEAFTTRAHELDGETTDGLLRLFYRFGIIGFVKKGGGGRGGSELSWQYKDPKERYNAGANNFRVHWSLKEYLDLVE